MRVNSTSKIKNIIATIKNFKEKGIRDEFIGSNPHSKGEFFSRSLKDFLARIDDKIIIIIEIKNDKKEAIKIIKIIYTKKNRLFDWKSTILYILYKLFSSSIDRNI